eukprot:CAMPEP_0115177238 /NCGR_PEP_ID=MMETSP0270-20121206/5282_1 /TAXON_ID=71861 /ORGANISM="Scrippsiella trochoidea, Strain CCMP3099" /LENGTH=150 /DNA_ID=CAMNT_0002590163 /DNA_START=234 /DNA_END=686 /DNA_ORIENTATION=+
MIWIPLMKLLCRMEPRVFMSLIHEASNWQIWRIIEASEITAEIERTDANEKIGPFLEHRPAGRADRFAVLELGRTQLPVCFNTAILVKRKCNEASRIALSTLATPGAAFAKLPGLIFEPNPDHSRFLRIAPCYRAPHIDPIISTVPWGKP